MSAARNPDPTATAAELHFTRFTALKPARLSKRFTLAADTLLKEGGGNLTDGIAERLSVGSLPEFAALLQTLTPRQALSYGVNGHDRARIVAKDATPPSGNDLPVINRTRDHFSWPDGAGILMLDYDPPAEGAPLDRDGLRAALICACPALADAPAIWRPSASSCIFAKTDGTELRGIGGQRLYVAVAEATDIPRALAILVDRLWLAGLGHWELSKSGAWLTRTVVDASVGQPERLDFCGGADCGRGLEQRLPEPVLFNEPAPYLNTRAELPDLTDEEQARLVHLREAGKESLLERQREIREAWISERVAAGLAQQPEERREERCPQLEATYRQAAEGGRLGLDFELTVVPKGSRTRKTVTVADLLRYQSRYHEGTTTDPLEPDYPDGQARLVGWLNLRAREPYLQSQAHGGIRYWLGDAPQTAEMPPDDDGYLDAVVADCQQAPTGSDSASGRAGVRSEAQEPPPIVRDGGKLPPQNVMAHMLVTEVFKNRLRMDPITNRWLEYRPDTGIFKPRPAGSVERGVYLAISDLQDAFPASYISGVTKLLAYEATTEIEPAHGKIPFQNGVLDLKTRELLPHSPAYGFTAAMPYPWDPNAPAPTAVIDWLLESVGGHTDQLQLLRAFLQAVVVGRPDLQRYLELVGPGGSGKGTFMRLAAALVGMPSVHSTQLSQLENNRFETAALFGKRLVLVTDAEKWRGDVSVLKSITGQDPIRYEQKHIQAGEAFTFNGMVILAGNQHLESTDYSSGIQRRRITVDFSHVVQPGQRRDLEAEFEPHLAGVMRWVLDMPEREVTAYLRSTSAHVGSLKQTRIDTLAQTNPIAGWCMDAVEFGPGFTAQVGTRKEIRITSGDGVGKAESWTEYDRQGEWLYPNYCRWCDERGKRPIACNAFAAQILDVAKNMLGQDVARMPRRAGGVRMSGLRIRRSYDGFDYEPNSAAPVSEGAVVVSNCVEPVSYQPIESVELFELYPNYKDKHSDFEEKAQDHVINGDGVENLGNVDGKSDKSAEVRQVQHYQGLDTTPIQHTSTLVRHQCSTTALAAPPPANPAPPRPDISPDIASASPVETPSATKAWVGNEPDMPSDTPPADPLAPRIAELVAEGWSPWNATARARSEAMHRAKPGARP